MASDDEDLLPSSLSCRYLAFASSASHLLPPQVRPAHPIHAEHILIPFSPLTTHAHLHRRGASDKSAATDTTAQEEIALAANEERRRGVHQPADDPEGEAEERLGRSRLAKENHRTGRPLRG